MSSIKVKSTPAFTVDAKYLKMHPTDKSELGTIPTSISINLDSTVKTDFLEIPLEFKVILFEYQNDFFSSQKKTLPKGYRYAFASTMEELNIQLADIDFQIVIFNYDLYPKAVNQMSAEIKKKLPATKVLIVSKAIEPEKAKVHANSSSGGAGYFQLPLDARRLDLELHRIHMDYRENEMRK